MGYLMDYQRVIDRNYLNGDYDDDRDSSGKGSILKGDLRRLELDTRDEKHLVRYAELTGISEEKVLQLFDFFFSGNEEFYTYKKGEK